MPALTIDLPAPLDLDLVVRSHGWYDLPPFRWDGEAHRLETTLLADGRPVPLRIVTRGRGLGLAVAFPDGASRGAVRDAARRILDLDADLDGFHALCRERSAEGFGWIAERGAGRILRSPTLFEDVVKVLSTTNCSWALTRIMVANLIRLFDRGGAFPDAAFLASLTEKDLREEVRAGYRARYFLGFAESVASGRLELTSWEDPARSDEELGKAIRQVPGFGPYAAQTLGRLLGRHRGLGLDSWSRKKVSELRFRGRAVADRRVEKLYAPFGRFAGLAFWLDVTRDWHGRSEALWPG